MQPPRNFEVQAKTCTIYGEKDSLWPAKSDGDRLSKLQVPIYQRGYSWGEAQIKRLVTDLINAFREQDQAANPSLFIGTMLLSEAVDSTQDIIDGQQRLTTILILLKALQKNETEQSDFVALISRFSTRVANEQQHWTDFNNGAGDAANNAYKVAEDLVETALDQMGIGKNNEIAEDGEKSFQTSAFIQFLLRSVYFVVIEAAGDISKKLQIFDSINTAGLDLGASDVFKIRYYDFLKAVHSKGESVFSEINELYKKVHESGGIGKAPLCTMDDVLGLYQTVVIGR